MSAPRHTPVAGFVPQPRFAVRPRRPLRACVCLPIGVALAAPPDWLLPLLPVGSRPVLPTPVEEADEEADEELDAEEKQEETNELAMDLDEASLGATAPAAAAGADWLWYKHPRPVKGMKIGSSGSA